MSEQMSLDLPSVAAKPSAATSVLAIGLMSGTSQDGVDVALDRYRRRKNLEFRRHRLPALYQGRAHFVAPRHRGGGEPDRAQCPAGRCRGGGGTGERRACAKRCNRSSTPTVCSRDIWRRSAFTDRRCCTGRSAGSRCRSAAGGSSPNGSAFPSSMIFAPPMSRPAGRARRSRRSFIRLWCGSWAATHRSRCSMSAASPT